MIARMKQGEITKLAEALGTTTAYLMDMEPKEETCTKLAPPPFRKRKATT